MSDLISVVIPAYNAADYLEVCLNAVCSQSYANMEILLVNDGSTDDTHAVAEKYSRYDGRVKLIETDNQGASAARNTGLEHASGKYVTFVDADDIPNIDLLEKYMGAVERFGNDAAVIIAGMTWYNSMNLNRKYENHLLAGEDGYETGKEYLLDRNQTHYLVWLKLFNFVTNKLYRLDVIKAEHIMFRPEIKNGEDLIFNLDYLKSASGGYGVVNEPLYRYIRRSEESLSLSYYSGCIAHTKKIYAELLDFVSAQADCTEDSKMVIKATGFTDWVSRLTAFYYCDTCGLNRTDRYCIINKEIRSREFRTVLSEVHQAEKISDIRYHALHTGNFRLYLLLRRLYRFVK